MLLHSPERRQPATHRLAFREIGLAIGLQAVEPRSDHDDIGDVMLATCLVPDGLLGPRA